LIKSIINDILIYGVLNCMSIFVEKNIQLKTMQRYHIMDIGKLGLMLLIIIQNLGYSLN